jgi:hypothetical protein
VKLARRHRNDSSKAFACSSVGGGGGCSPDDAGSIVTRATEDVLVGLSMKPPVPEFMRDRETVPTRPPPPLLGVDPDLARGREQQA